MSRKHTHASSTSSNPRTPKDFPPELDRSILPDGGHKQEMHPSLFTLGALDLIRTQMHGLGDAFPNTAAAVDHILADTLELQLLHNEVDGVLRGQTDAIDQFVGLMNRVMPPGRETGRFLDFRDWMDYKPGPEPVIHDPCNLIPLQRYGDLFLAAHVAAGSDFAMRERLFRGMELLAFRTGDVEALYRAALEPNGVDRFAQTAQLLTRDRGFFSGGLSSPDEGRLGFPWPIPGPNPGIPDICELTRLFCIGELTDALRKVGPPIPTIAWADNITSINPTRACPGEQVTITGTGFGATQPSDYVVLFPSNHGCTEATVVSWSDTQIVVLAPPDAHSGCIGFYSTKALAAANDAQLILNEALDAIESSLACLHLGTGESMSRLPPILFPPCPPCTGRNGFEGAGPEIDYFHANGSQSLSVEPGSTVTLSWSVRGGRFSLERTSLEGPPLSMVVNGPGSVTLSPMTPTDHLATVTYRLSGANSCGSISRQVNIEVRRHPDLTAQGLEVTQATQFYRSNQHLSAATQEADNVVPLIENRRTLVRLYVDSGLVGFDLGDGVGVVAGMTGRLWGWRNGILLPGAPLNPLNAPIRARHSDAYLNTRRAWDRTLNFELPSTWLNGTVELRAEAFFNHTVIEPDYTNNRVSTTISFSPARRLKLVGVRVHYTGWQSVAGTRSRVDIAAPAYNRLVTAANWLRRSYPVNGIDFFVAPGNETIDFDGDLTDGSGGGCGTEWGKLMNRLKQLASDYTGDDDAVWVGLLPTGWTGAAWGGCGGGANDTIGVAVIFANDTGPVLAQEAGHGYGRNHAPGCNAGSPDASYPAYGKASTASIGEFGVDIPPAGSSTWIIRDPASANDFMGYCGTDWVSPYTYRGLYNGGISPSSSLPAGEGHGGHTAYDFEREVLVLQGRIYRNGKVDLQPAFHYPRLLRAPRGMESGYELELLDAEGTPLEVVPIMLQEPMDVDRPAGVDFSLQVALSPLARQLRIVRDDQEILRREISETTPKITRVRVRELPRPRQEDEKVERNLLLVNWTAQTPSRPLWYKVRYSADGGEHWMGVIPLTEEPKVTLDLATLPGGENCLVEVYASDGLATGRARSDFFAVPHKPPRLVISEPQKADVSEKEAIILLGAGFDEEGHSLPDNALIWSSDVDGELGMGPVLEVSLSPGQHQITLSGQDDRGLVGSTSIELAQRKS